MRRGPKSIEFRRGEKIRVSTLPDDITLQGDVEVAGDTVLGGSLLHPTGGEFLGLVTAADEPTLSAGQWCIWVDSDNDNTYLVVHNGTGQVKTSALS